MTVTGTFWIGPRMWKSQCLRPGFCCGDAGASWSRNQYRYFGAFLCAGRPSLLVLLQNVLFDFIGCLLMVGGSSWECQQGFENQYWIFLLFRSVVHSVTKSQCKTPWSQVSGSRCFKQMLRFVGGRCGSWQMFSWLFSPRSFPVVSSRLRPCLCWNNSPDIVTVQALLSLF